MIDESDDFHDPINTDEDYDADDINTVNDMDGTRRVRIRAAIATTGNWQGELDDGEEDPDYYSDDVRYPWNMPSWFPDWLVNKTLHPSSLWPDPNTAPTTTTSTDNNQEDSPDPSNSVLSKRPRRPAILDIVYTWVNGSDPEWQYSKHVYVQKDPTLCQTSNVKKTESFMESRFRDNNELLHSVRSTFMFGNKIVKKFHIATADVAECVEGHDAEQGQGVFQAILDHQAQPYPTGHDDDDDLLKRGYDDNIRFANYHLSKRFGFRYRPYIARIVQTASRSVLKEAEALWPEAFFQTESTHFRSDYDGNSLQSMFLVAHYTIERLRETQLRSFWRYRVDYNENDELE
ncbi:hypothetical protein BGX33_009137 [Mortierella sp. NVP41]|nr:hypothetical protein BGX33_009137 [Mortierella sp. NVP41]